MRPTANRIRKHLEDTINWAIAEGVRKDESNPAEVKRLEFSLSFKKRDVKHYPSLPYDQAPDFLTNLRSDKGVKAKALEFVMLTAVRVADICGGGKDHSEPMQWSHVDMSGQFWIIPDTKMGQPHVVPLSDAAMLLLAQMRRLRDPKTDFVFPGSRRGTVINASTLRYLLQKYGLCRDRNDAWYARHLQHMGVGNHRLRRKNNRFMPGSRAGRTGCGLPPWLLSRQAPAPDGCMGGLLRRPNYYARR